MNARQNRGEYCVINQRSGLGVASRVHVAGTSAERRQGLMGVGGLSKGSGLWIVPCEAIHTFGMKMPIDALFLDDDFRVRKLTQNLRPYRISACMRASSVLEVEAGTISKSDVRLGDVLSFRSARLAEESVA